MQRIFACFVRFTTGFMPGTASARCASRARSQLDGRRSVLRVEPGSRALAMRQADSTPGIDRTRKFAGATLDDGDSAASASAETAVERETCSTFATGLARGCRT